MKNFIENEIKKFVKESKENWLDEIEDHYYDEPIIGFASADDQLFEEYKKIIDTEHLTPKEAFEISFGEGSYKGGTIISIVLPISEKIRKSNGLQKEWPSKEWTLLRTFGDEVFIRLLAGFLEECLRQRDCRAIVPSMAEWHKIYRIASGPTSNWSERHVAYAAGNGTFSINDGFITEKGIAVRLISVITDLVLEPNARTAKNHVENCLLCSKGICGACIKRCPVNAITEKGHDKLKCYQYVYGEESRKLAEARGTSPKAGGGCGLCQTNVPCEYKNPIKSL